MAIRKVKWVENEEAMAGLRAIASDPNVGWLQELDRHTQAAARIMSKIHGGNWCVTADHHDGFLILIMRSD